MLNKFRKRTFLLLAALLLLGFIYSQFQAGPGVHFSRDFSWRGFELHDKHTRQLMHFNNYKFLLADKLEQSVGSWDAFMEKPLSERCTHFFQIVDLNLPDWEVNFLRDGVFDKHIVKKGEFFKAKWSKLRKIRKKDPDPSRITPADNNSINKEYEENYVQTLDLEQQMADTMTIIRVFGHCFYSEHRIEPQGALQLMYDRYSAKIVPFFTSKLPRASAGDVTTDVGWFPESLPLGDNDNLLDFYYKNMRGQGIVLSASTRHARDIVKFIHVLRALGNKLPIEVLYRADLLAKSRQSIILAGSLSKEELLSDELSDYKILSSSLRLASIDVSEIAKLEFPKQQITLINMQKPLSKLAKSDFSSYNNKILALFFSSFEKVLLFDTDTVPLLSPESILNLKEFTQKGAYFFKDRSLMDKNDWVETNFFAKLMPHVSNQVDMALGVPPVTSHTLKNAYMAGWRHCQEAGLVALDKRRHFRALLALFPLSLWGEPVRSLIWGDKEMYWLAMSMVGDEDYVFNKFGAASIGEITSKSSMKQYNNSKATELCSSHPGHVSADGQLLWINSGFSYCKKNGFVRDRPKFPYSVFEDREQVKAIYEAPLKVRHAVVPPDQPNLRNLDPNSDMSAETSFLSSMKMRKPDVDQLKDTDQISTYDPQKGWVKNHCCSDYQYCAYDAIESFSEPKTLEKSGHVFEFSPKDTHQYDLLGAIWLSSLRVGDLKPKSAGKAAGKTGILDFTASLPAEDEEPVSGVILLPPDNSSSVPEIKSKNSKPNAVPEIQLFDHMGEPVANYQESLNKEKQEEDSGLPSEKENDVEFDITKVRERPEKLNLEVKKILKGLFSKESGSV